MVKYNMRDRKDMSMGLKDYDRGYDKGYEKGKYDKGYEKVRNDELRNDKYMNSVKGMNQTVMGHEGRVFPIETTSCQKYDLNRMQWLPSNRRGYDMKAYDYKY